MNIFKFFKTSKDDSFKKVAEQQLEENGGFIRSLRDYDEGKKNISTTDLERGLPGIRVAPRG